MRNEDWMEIQEWYPHAFDECKNYFIQHNSSNWRYKMKQDQHIFKYLAVKGLRTRVSGIDRFWWYDIWKGDKVVASGRNFNSETEANLVCIRQGFHEIAREEEI